MKLLPCVCFRCSSLLVNKSNKKLLRELKSKKGGRRFKIINMASKANYIKNITVKDPDTNNAVDLCVFKHDNGGMFAINDVLAFKKSNEWKDSLAISKFLSDIDNIDDLTAILAPKNIDLERSEYYVEFGSSKYDDVLLSRNDLYKIFQRLIDQDELLIKKRLHQWGNSKNKIRRILKLYPENKTKKLFDFIHPDLASFLNFLDSILKKEHNSSLPSALGLELWEGLIVFSFGYWSSKNLILYSLRDLIQMYLSQVFNQLSISKEDFLLQLKESTSQPLEGVKHRLIDNQAYNMHTTSFNSSI